MTIDWKKESSQPLYEDQWLKLHKDVFTSGDLKKEYTLVYRKDCVVIIPLTQDGQTLIQSQFRMAVFESLWEFPAGQIDSGQTAEQAAAIELKEETGLVVQSLEYIGKFYPIAGLTAQKAEVYIAHVDENQLLTLASEDAAESISEHRIISLAEVRAMAGRGEVTEAFTLAALSILSGSTYGGLFY